MARLLIGLVLLTLISVSAVGWFGWRMLEQERFVESQHAQERLEQAADRIVATARRTLAEIGDRLGDSGPPLKGSLFLQWNEASLRAEPQGSLLYLPFPASEPDPGVEFAEAEQFEFLHGQPSEARVVYERLAQTAKPETRAGALLRMARVLRAMGRKAESRAAYEKLAAMQATTAGAPSELVAGLELGRTTQLLDDLRRGRWPLTRGQFEFYWSRAGGAALPREATLFSEVAARVWESRARNPEPRGQDSFWIAGQPYFLIWRGSPEKRSVLIAPPGSWLAPVSAGEGVVFAAVDADGRLLAGQRDTGSRAVVRTAAEGELPWAIYVAESQPTARASLPAKQRFLLVGLSVMVLFLILGAWLIVRAIRREAELVRMQSDFVSAVSHEFRSPLTSLRQLSEILALGRVPSDDRRQLYYETLVKETTRLQRVVEALLNFGKMEAGARQYRFESVDAAELVRRVAAEFEPQMEIAGRRIEVGGLPRGAVIDADPDAICVALRNLLDNAIKYSPHHPIVWVDCGAGQRSVSIAVRDRGPSIPGQERKAIFGKFVRGSAAASLNVKGSGVGLAMVRHIVAAHGGEVTLKSESGSGSTFTILLPAAERA